MSDGTDVAYPTSTGLGDPLEEIRNSLEAATAPTLDPEDQIAQLDWWTERLTDLLGLAQTYRADSQLVREAQVEADTNAEIREQLLRRGLATAEELEGLGYTEPGAMSKSSPVVDPPRAELGYGAISAPDPIEQAPRAEIVEQVGEEPSVEPDAPEQHPEPDPEAPPG